MIRLRTVQNQLVDLPSETRFVELLDQQGLLAAVVYQDEQGVVVQAQPGSPPFDRYCRLFKIRPTGRSINLSQELP